MIVPSSLSQIRGPNLRLRLIRPCDSDYVHALRTNPAYNRYLSPVRGTAEDQRRWIEEYKAREAAGQEYYYLIERAEGGPCGVVRLYDVDTEAFTWGSWILDQNKPRKAAVESALLSFGIGFETLALKRAFLDVRIENKHALAFYQRFGMTEIDRTDQDIFFVFTREQFRNRLADFEALLGKQR